MQKVNGKVLHVWCQRSHSSDTLCNDGVPEKLEGELFYCLVSPENAKLYPDWNLVQNIVLNRTIFF